MRIVIVEDEQPARDKLRAALLCAAPVAQIVAELSGVAETIAWLSRNPKPDLMFLDIQLSDGLCFEILRGAPVRFPVIFARLR
jgi:DNA-binding LytR/AlgR family response regulator